MPFWQTFRIAAEHDRQTPRPSNEVVPALQFREPRNIVEVAILPLIVMLSGVIWIEASAGFGPVSSQPARPAPSLAIPAGALLLVMAFFQLVLKPGIAFS